MLKHAIYFCTHPLTPLTLSELKIEAASAWEPAAWEGELRKGWESWGKCFG